MFLKHIVIEMLEYINFVFTWNIYFIVFSMINLEESTVLAQNNIKMILDQRADWTTSHVSKYGTLKVQIVSVIA